MELGSTACRLFAQVDTVARWKPHGFGRGADVPSCGVFSRHLGKMEAPQLVSPKRRARQPYPYALYLQIQGATVRPIFYYTLQYA